MSFKMYLWIGYLAVINIITLFLYIREAKNPTLRQPALLLILLPIIGGSIGAIIANYLCDVELRELRSHLSIVLNCLPPIILIVQLVVVITIVGIDNTVTYVCDFMYAKVGIIGYILLIVNVLSFILVMVRKLSRYFVSYEKTSVSDKILIPLLILGGATGGLLAKIFFNLKEDWSCNATMRIQNFIYNWGMFLLAIIQIGLFFLL